jgi:hypothetical protein
VAGVGIGFAAAADIDVVKAAGNYTGGIVVAKLVALVQSQGMARNQKLVKD